MPDDEVTDCWFEEPGPGDRRSWAIPPGHGQYLGIDVERLDPDDEDELMLLVEALHEDHGYGSGDAEDGPASDEEFSPRLHVTMHQVVARQILADEPPKTWQTVQRLAGLGYDWHNIMHMIAELVTHDVYAALADKKRFDPEDYARRLDGLPGDWPAPDAC